MTIRTLWRRAGALALLAAAGASFRAEAAEFHLGDPAAAFAPASARFRLAGLGPGAPARTARPRVLALHRAHPDGEESPAPPKKIGLFETKTVVLTAGVFVVTPVLSYFAWWRDSERDDFTFARENWFGESTYAGGADKVSHAFYGYLAQKLIQSGYERLGHAPDRARWMSVFTTSVAGVLVELGDGFAQYGFAWEDFASNMVGAAFAAEIDRRGLDDTVGMRFGLVKALTPDPCCRYSGYGGDYSHEIYGVDVKLAGLLPRLGKKPGVLRFLQAGLTYATKGYRHSGPSFRQRTIGLDVGVNLPEILRAVGVKDSSWWGKPLLTLLTYFRIPYTALNVRYDLNQGRWHGPDAGDRYDPGTYR